MDLVTSPTPGVPLNEARVLELATTVFGSGPRHLGWYFHVAVDCADFDILGRKGRLRMISPEETAHAFLFTIANAISTSAPEDELLRWRHVSLTAPFVFELIPRSEDVLWRSHYLRQALSVDYTSMKRSAYQSAHDVFMMKARVEKELPADANAKTVLEALISKATPTNKMEFTANYIECALAVHRTVCRDPAIVRCLTRLEGTYGLRSCLNSIIKLYEIVRKCPDEVSRIWVFQGIVDGVESNTYINGAVSKYAMVGKSCNVGLVQLLLFKRICLLHFLGTALPNAGFASGDLNIIRERMSDHIAYRAGVASLPDQPAPERSWIDKLASSSLLAMQLIEAW